jgi:SAM-dependent methyltransferase
MSADADANRAWWDERAALHGGDGFFYDVDAFLAGAPGITEREVSELEAAIGSIASADILHVQCHIGLTTLALARAGAGVVGLDFSRVAIDRARLIASNAQLGAEFVVADSQDLPLELVGRFDCVFASYGVLMWVADLRSWMRSAIAALRDGGKLVIVEGHPISTVVRSIDPIRLAGGYQGGAVYEGEGGDYVDRGAELEHTRFVHYRWGLGDLVTTAIEAGFVIEALTEWMDDPRGVPPGVEKLTLDEEGHGRLRVAGGELPLEYAIRAVKPTNSTI